MLAARPGPIKKEDFSVGSLPERHNLQPGVGEEFAFRHFAPIQPEPPELEEVAGAEGAV